MLGTTNRLDFGFIATVTRQEEERKKLQTVNGFDSAAGDAAQVVLSADVVGFDSELSQMRRSALYATFQLADDILEDELEEGELPSDRLDAFLRSAVADHTGDEDEENSQLNQQIIQIFAANMSDAMASLGADDETIAAAFGTDVDDADAAVQKIAEIIDTNIPKSDEELEAFIESFLYGEGELDMAAGSINEFDSAELGKNKVRKNKYGQTFVYKGVKAVRQGKITVVNKRVGNTMMKAKLSPKQKAALRKASAKAITPNAIKKRLKSINIGRRNGLYGKKGL